jgi:heat-inducible transcriptional repressor
MLARDDVVVVTIGDENDTMKDCTLITATYHVDGKLVGKIGVIGPTRMKDDEITSIMEYLTNNLSESFKLTDSTDSPNDTANTDDTVNTDNIDNTRGTGNTNNTEDKG